MSSHVIVPTLRTGAKQTLTEKSDLVAQSIAFYFANPGNVFDQNREWNQSYRTRVAAFETDPARLSEAIRSDLARVFAKRFPSEGIGVSVTAAVTTPMPDVTVKVYEITITVTDENNNMILSSSGLRGADGSLIVE